MKKQMTNCFLAFLLLFFFFSCAAPSAFGWQDRAAARNRSEKLALVVGNSYLGTKGALKNPINDARGIAAALEKSGFTVMLRTELSKRQFDDAIYEFGRRLATAKVGVFYFAGHGMQVDGRNYLIPLGARLSSKSDAAYETIDAGRVLGKMQDSHCPMNIVILDACRNNPFKSWRVRGSDEEGLAQVRAPSGSLIAYATQPGNTSLDGWGDNSPYTAAILKNITIPGIPIEQFFKRVRRNVAYSTDNKQIPWESTSLLGDFSFFGGEGQSFDYGSPSSLSKTYTDPTTGMEFVFVKGGCYQMGDTFGDGDKDEKPVHKVCVDDFYMGKYEVTQGQWQKIMGNNPSHFKKGDNYPVEQVSWNDITEDFLPELNRRSGKTYRLPTEAEWEYAARSGGKQEKYAGGDNVDVLAWYNESENFFDGFINGSSNKVGTKKANGLGLYDMSGNVDEWCLDWYGEGYYANSPEQNPQGAGQDSIRVIRGGSWNCIPRNVRAADRSRNTPGNASSSLGFRLVLPVH